MASTDSVRLLVIEPSQVAALGIRAILSRRSRYEIQSFASSIDEAKAFLQKTPTPPHIVICSYVLPEDQTGVDMAHLLRRRWPWLPMLLYSSLEEQGLPQVVRELEIPALVSKLEHHSVLLSALDALQRGERFISPQFRKLEGRNGGAGCALSERQRAVLQLSAQGAPNSEIAERLGIGEETVRSHFKAVLRKLNARDRAQAVAIGLRSGLIRLLLLALLVAAAHDHLTEPVSAAVFHTQTVLTGAQTEAGSEPMFVDDWPGDSAEPLLADL